MGRNRKKTDYRGFFVIQILVSEKWEILIRQLPANQFSVERSRGKTFQLKMADYEEVLARVRGES